MKTVWIATAAALALAVPAYGESKGQEKNVYELPANQMHIVNMLLAKMLPELGDDYIYSLLVTRIDEAGEELPDQQLLQVSDSARRNYLAAAAPPPEACLSRFTKSETWYDSGVLVRNYFCQHPNYNGPSDNANRKLRHDLYYGTSTTYWGNLDPDVECMVNNQPNPALSTSAFQKLCFQKIN